MKWKNMSSDAKTIILKTLNFVTYLAEESKDLSQLVKELKKYKEKMEKQEYVSILEELEKL